MNGVSEYWAAGKSVKNPGKGKLENFTVPVPKRPVFFRFSAATNSTVLGSSVECFTQSWVRGARGLD